MTKTPTRAARRAAATRYRRTLRSASDRRRRRRHGRGRAVRGVRTRRRRARRRRRRRWRRRRRGGSVPASARARAAAAAAADAAAAAAPGRGARPLRAVDRRRAPRRRGRERARASRAAGSAARARCRSCSRAAGSAAARRRRGRRRRRARRRRGRRGAGARARRPAAALTSRAARARAARVLAHGGGLAHSLTCLSVEHGEAAAGAAAASDAAADGAVGDDARAGAASRTKVRQFARPRTRARGRRGPPSLRVGTDARRSGSCTAAPDDGARGALSGRRCSRRTRSAHGHVPRRHRRGRGRRRGGRRRGARRARACARVLALARVAQAVADAGGLALLPLPAEDGMPWARSRAEADAAACWQLGARRAADPFRARPRPPRPPAALDVAAAARARARVPPRRAPALCAWKRPSAARRRQRGARRRWAAAAGVAADRGHGRSNSPAKAADGGEDAAAEARFALPAISAVLARGERELVDTWAATFTRARRRERERRRDAAAGGRAAASASAGDAAGGAAGGRGAAAAALASARAAGAAPPARRAAAADRAAARVHGPALRADGADAVGHPAVCLACGLVLCGDGKGECTRHAARCGGGCGVYFLLQECTVLLVHGPRALLRVAVRRRVRRAPRPVPRAAALPRRAADRGRAPAVGDARRRAAGRAVALQLAPGHHQLVLLAARRAEEAPARGAADEARAFRSRTPHPKPAESFRAPFSSPSPGAVVCARTRTRRAHRRARARGDRAVRACKVRTIWRRTPNYVLISAAWRHAAGAPFGAFFVRCSASLVSTRSSVRHVGEGVVSRAAPPLRLALALRAVVLLARPRSCRTTRTTARGSSAAVGDGALGARGAAPEPAGGDGAFRGAASAAARGAAVAGSRGEREPARDAQRGEHAHGDRTRASAGSGLDDVHAALRG